MTVQRHHLLASICGTVRQGAVPEPGHFPAAAQLVRVQLEYPAPGSARLVLSGEVDLSNTDRLGELVCSRLRSELQLVVLDLSALEFLSVSGAGMLVRAATVAGRQGTELRILPGDSSAVRRVLRVTGLDQHLPLC